MRQSNRQFDERNSGVSLVSQGEARPAPDEDFIDLARLLKAVFEYKWGILGLALSLTVIAGLVVFSMEPIYRAATSITLETGKVNLVGVEDVYSANSNSHLYALYTEFEILNSRGLVERTVRRLKLHEHPVFNANNNNEDSGFSVTRLLPASEREPPVQLTPEEIEERRIQATTNAVAAGVTAQQLGEYSLIAYVAYESTDRKLAALVPNTIAEEFINSNLEHRLSGTLQATEWLNERLADLKQKLYESEQALQNFREQEGLVDIQGETGLGSNELQSLSLRLQDARRSRIEVQNIMEDLRAIGDAKIEDLMANPAVLQHPVIRDIKREQAMAERKVSELAKRYGALHPKMIAAQSDLAASRENLEREVKKVVTGIEREYQIALRNEQQLEDTWESRKSEMQEFNRVEFRLQELQREVDANRQLYDVFFARIKSVSETGGFEKPHARIVDRARVPGTPVKPNKRLTIALAFALGIVLGCGIAIVLDMLDSTVKSPDDVEERLHAPLLATLPVQSKDSSGVVEHVWAAPRTLYAEAVRTLRTSLLLSDLDSDMRVIVVTSTLPGEGKSTTSLNLASAMGQMEKVLLIGADLRRPSLAGKCDLNPNHEGLSQFVAGTAELDECIEFVEDIGIHVMPAGVIPPNPLEMLSSARFKAALNSLRDEFDRIILDSAPVHAVSDGLVLASYADSVVYVVNAGQTPATLAQRSIAKVVGSNEPLAGVVLNQFDIKKAGGYFRGSYYQYDDYYQSEPTRS